MNVILFDENIVRISRLYVFNVLQLLLFSIRRSKSTIYKTKTQCEILFIFSRISFYRPNYTLLRLIFPATTE